MLQRALGNGTVSQKQSVALKMDETTGRIPRLSDKYPGSGCLLIYRNQPKGRKKKPQNVAKIKSMFVFDYKRLKVQPASD